MFLPTINMYFKFLDFYCLKIYLILEFIYLLIFLINGVNLITFKKSEIKQLKFD